MTAIQQPSTRLQYGERPGVPGMYLGLFHGRRNPKEQMSDWGFAGPVLGPLQYCHTTYMAFVHLHFVSGGDARTCCNSSYLEVELEVGENMIEFEGAYYEDWTVLVVSPEECRRPDYAFRSKPRTNAHQWHNNFSSAQSPKNT
ncbi:hypothetical protein [Acidovorax sp. RAC01]|uniref:hypothetical protein n=1 Tax=Acidovorax sp. RAC01 TaxID=1842533 RepID=UPI00083E8B1F|nr:hypothetical protein [Acidovorax sp. RAC01]AOG24147.1 hypothetical protein BSY15_1445 [Acidovorax sp. RAC01]